MRRKEAAHRRKECVQCGEFYSLEVALAAQFFIRMKGIPCFLLLLQLISTSAMICSRLSLRGLRGNNLLSFRGFKNNRSDRPHDKNNKGFNGRDPRSSEPKDPSIIIVPKTHIKRKVAVALSYVGSNYHGLQIDNVSNVPTVEAEIQKVFHDLGFISDANFGDLKKIQWSRSSRTDKHVHCARLIISAKLEIPVTWTNDNDSKVINFVEKCNAVLPADIRVLAVSRMNQGFRAREACTWREYEYVLPKSLLLSGLLTDSDSDKNTKTQEELKELSLEKERAILALFARNLKRMEGPNSFHNFHRLSAKKTKRNDRNDWSKGRDDKDPADDEESEEEEEEDETPGTGNTQLLLIIRPTTTMLLACFARCTQAAVLQPFLTLVLPPLTILQNCFMI